MQTFTLSPEQFAAKRAQVEQAVGHPLDGEKGSIDHEGVIVAYQYVAPKLAVEITHKPFYVPTSVIEGKIAEWFDA